MGYRDRHELVPEDDPHWTLFWNSFPKRVAKKDARRAWAQLKPDAETVNAMLNALEWQVPSPEWTKDGGQYIPYPASYLRGRRFEDEPPVRPQKVMGDAAATVFATLGMKL